MVGKWIWYNYRIPKINLNGIVCCIDFYWSFSWKWWEFNGKIRQRFSNSENLKRKEVKFYSCFFIEDILKHYFFLSTHYNLTIGTNERLILCRIANEWYRESWVTSKKDWTGSVCLQSTSDRSHGLQIFIRALRDILSSPQEPSRKSRWTSSK